MTEILLARHGETDWNRERRIQGQTDVPLNDAGRAQAAALAEELASERVDAVYSSDLGRALETARTIAERHAVEVVVLPGLRERDFGTWEGLTDAEILERFPHARTQPWGDAETHEQLAGRVLTCLREITERHPDGRVVVVTHGGPMHQLWFACGGSDDDRPSIGNCAVHRIAAEGGVVTRLD